jgi:hypothetical protein
MGLHFDVSRPVMRPSDRLALVEAVLGAHPSDECEWIEWKTAVPLEQAAGRFTFARHVIGFANRSPSEASRHVAGQAFLIIGAEPSASTGSVLASGFRTADGPFAIGMTGAQRFERHSV